MLLTILCISYTPPSQAIENSAPQANLRTGFFLNSFPDLSLEDLKVALSYWTEEVGKQAGITTDIHIYTSLDQMRTDFYTGKINLIVASPLIIVKEFDKKQLADGFKITWSDKAEDNLLVVTNIGSKLNHFKAVKNTKLSLLKNDTITKLYADVLSLQYFGKPSKLIFNQIEYLKKSSQLIYKLFFNNTDVIFVSELTYELAVELNPQIKDKTQIISILPGIPRALGFFHIREDLKFRESVLQVVEKLDTHTRGRHLLSLFKADKTVRSHISDLINTEQLQQKHLKLLNPTRP